MSIIQRQFKPYVCNPKGQCVEDPKKQSRLSQYACEQGCSEERAAEIYWDMAQQFVNNIIEALQDVKVEDEDDREEDQRMVFDMYLKTFEKKETEAILTLDVKYYAVFQSYSFEVYENNVLCFNFSIYLDKPDIVRVSLHSFFVRRHYREDAHQLTPDKFLQLSDFIGLGFCTKIGCKLKFVFKDEWSTEKIMMVDGELFKVTLQSFWTRIARGFTYYENRGYEQTAQHSMYYTALSKVLFIGNKTVCEIATALFYPEESFEQTFCHLFAGGSKLSKSAMTIAVANFERLLKQLKKTDGYRNTLLFNQFKKSFKSLSMEDVRTMVYFKQVTATPVGLL